MQIKRCRKKRGGHRLESLALSLSHTRADRAGTHRRLIGGMQFLFFYLEQFIFLLQIFVL